LDQIEIVLCEDEELVGGVSVSSDPRHPPRPRRRLRPALLARDKERTAPIRGEARQRLKEEGRLSHPGIAPQERDPAEDGAPAEHAIELPDPGGQAGGMIDIDVPYRDRGRPAPPRLTAPGGALSHRL